MTAPSPSGGPQLFRVAADPDSVFAPDQDRPPVFPQPLPRADGDRLPWSYSGAFWAGAVTESPPVSLAVKAWELRNLIDLDGDPEFDPSAHDIRGYEDHIASFAWADSVDELNVIKASIDRERAAREYLRTAGAFGWGSAMAAGILDPLILVPVGGQLRAAQELNALVKAGTLRATEGVRMSMLATARAGLVGGSLSESILFFSQDERTFGEGALNISAATLLSGVLGASAGALSADLARRIKLDAEDVLRVQVGKTRNKRPPSQEPGKELAGTPFSRGEIEFGPVAGGSGVAAPGENRILSAAWGNRWRSRQTTRQLMNPHTNIKTRLKVAGTEALDIARGLGRLKATPTLEVFTNSLTEATRRAWTVMVDTGSLDVRLSTGEVAEVSLERLMQQAHAKHGFLTEQGLAEYAQYANRVRVSAGKAEVGASPLGLARIAVEGSVARHQSGSILPGVDEAGRAVPMKQGEWFDRLTDLVRHPKIKSNIPELQKLANDRREFLKQLLDEHKAAGAIKTEATSFADDVPADELEQLVTRIYNRDAIRRDPDTFADLVGEGIQKRHDQLADKTIERARERHGQREVRRLLQHQEQAARTQKKAAAADAATEGVDALTIRIAKHLVDTGSPKVADVRAATGATARQVTAAMKSLELAGVVGPARKGVTRAIVADAVPENLAAVLKAARREADELAAKVKAGDARAKPAEEPFVPEPFDEALWNERADAIRLTPAEAKTIAVQVRERIMGIEGATHFSNVDYIKLVERLAAADTAKGARRSEVLKEMFGEVKASKARPNAYDPKTAYRRTLWYIDDETLKPYIENDWRNIQEAIHQHVVPRLEFQKRFGADGAGYENLVEGIKREHRELVERVVAAHPTNTPQRQKLLEIAGKEEERALFRMDAMRDILLNRYGHDATSPDAPFSRAGAIARGLNYITVGGGFAITSVPDVGNIILNNGFKRVFGQALPLFTQNRAAFNLAADEAKRAGVAFDLVLSQRIGKTFEVGDISRSASRFERNLSNISQTFGVANGHAWWNTTMKRFTAVVAQSKILDDVVGGGDEALERLAQAGIGDKDRLRILGQWRRGRGQGLEFEELGGATIDGVKLANTAVWDDPRAVKLFRNVLLRDVDSTIVTPGAGDKPIWTHRDIGRVVAQFKSFGFAATNRILVPTAQRISAGDREIAWRMTLPVILGMGVYIARTQAGNRDVNLDPVVLLREGIDRSGLLGIVTDANNILERVSGGRLGIAAALGGHQGSRYASRNVAGALAGPSFGKLSSALQVANAGISNDWSDSDVRKLRAMVPYNNLWWLDGMFDLFESGARAALPEAE